MLRETQEHLPHQGVTETGASTTGVTETGASFTGAFLDVNLPKIGRPIGNLHLSEYAKDVTSLNVVIGGVMRIKF